MIVPLPAETIALVIPVRTQTSTSPKHAQSRPLIPALESPVLPPKLLVPLPKHLDLHHKPLILPPKLLAPLLQHLPDIIHFLDLLLQLVVLSLNLLALLIELLTFLLKLLGRFGTCLDLPFLELDLLLQLRDL